MSEAMSEREAAERSARALERIARSLEFMQGMSVILVLGIGVIIGCLWTIATHV